MKPENKRLFIPFTCCGRNHGAMLAGSYGLCPVCNKWRLIKEQKSRAAAKA